MAKKPKGGRRQILQLEDKKQPKGASNKGVKKSLLHYSDSDEDSKISYESDISAPNKDTCPLDTQVADFFKEIDALSDTKNDVHEGSENINKEGHVEAQFLNLESNIDLASNINEDINVDHKIAEKDILSCHWQVICDASSGYNYYWHTETNEVTWDIPKEYAEYLKSSYYNDTSQNSCKSEKKPIINKKEKKESIENIIPISYFEGSSSENDSDSENVAEKICDKNITKPFFTTDSNTNLLKGRKVKSENYASSKFIGPQLPVDFQFSQATENTLKSIKQCNKPYEKTVDSLHLGNSYSSQSSQITEKIILTCSEVSVPTKTTDGTDKLDSSNTVFRGIVEYDSFSDEEEELNCSNDFLVKVKEQNICPLASTNDDKLDSLSNEPILKVTNCLKTHKSAFPVNDNDCNVNKKFKWSDVNIDKMFSEQNLHLKYGFGFQKNSEENFPDEISEIQVQNRSITFIKADVLDLNFLNKPFLSDNGERILNENSVNSEDLESRFKDDIELLSIPESPPNNLGKIEKDNNVSDDTNDCGSAECMTTSSHKDASLDSTEFNEEEDIISSEKRSLLSLLNEEENFDDSDLSVYNSLEEKEKIKNIISNFEEELSESNHSTLKEDEDIVIVNIKKVNLKEDIKVLSSILIDKLTFLLSNNSSMTVLNNLYVQLQTRLMDWEASSLESTYFLNRLKEVDEYFHQYESSVVSSDWRCEWDRNNKRYYYRNVTTQETQWTFPEEYPNQDHIHELPKTCVSHVEHQNITSTVTKSITDNDLEKDISDSSSIHWNIRASPPPPPGVDSPVPLPPLPGDDSSLPSPQPKTTTPPFSPKHIEVINEPEDMDLDSNDSFPYTYNSIKPCDIQEESKNIPGILISLPNSVETLSSSSTDTLNFITYTGKQAFCDSSISPHSAQSFLQSQLRLTPNTLSNDNVGAVDSQDNVNYKKDKLGSSIKKEKKKKPLHALSLKKKNLPFLVQKWQKIKEDQKKDL